MHVMAVAIRQSHPVTDEELMELSRLNPGYQLERAADGRLVVTPTASNSGRRNAELLRRLGNWNAEAGLGEVFDSNTGFRLPDGSVLSPDASWIVRSRWNALPSEERETYAPLCPDAVFELRSRTDSLTELQAKMQAYIRNGARLGLLVDPFDRIVELYRPGMEPVRVSPDSPVSLDPELPGFELHLTQVMA